MTYTYWDTHTSLANEVLKNGMLMVTADHLHFTHGSAAVSSDEFNDQLIDGLTRLLHAMGLRFVEPPKTTRSGIHGLIEAMLPTEVYPCL